MFSQRCLDGLSFTDLGFRKLGMCGMGVIVAYTGLVGAIFSK